MSEIVALEGRVNRLEGQITDGFDRLENLLRQEINDLKKEQIDDLKKANERVADDQRRLWDRLVDMERRENRRSGDHAGTNRILGSIFALTAAAFGGFVTWLVAYFTSGNPPPHH